VTGGPAIDGAAFLAERPREPLPPWAREMAATVDLDALAERVVGRDIAVAFPQLTGDAEFAEHLRASVRENLRALQQVLCGRLALGQVRLAQPLELARVQARMGIPQTALQRSYRVGFATMWQEWAERLRAAAEAMDVPRAEALGALAQLTVTIFDYQDHVASQVAEQYARADEALSRSRAHVRQALVREILRGATSLPPSDLVTLDYDLAAWHLAVVLPAAAVGTATQLTIGLRGATGVRHSLVHPLALSRTALWLGHPTGWPPEGVRRLRQVLADVGVEASLSEPRAGLAGFREALEQAEEVERVREAWGRGEAPRVLQHRDVALEILLLRDPDRARGFVRAELGPLAEDTPEAARLRETLDASFRLGTHVAAAEHLGLHEHTVRNRLHRAEEHLGHPLAERRTELQIALRLQRLLGDAG
jgi:DNA-binding PucR family transcriptional regulator